MIKFLISKFDIRYSKFDILFLSVFFVSFSTLAFEVLLTRFFSIAQWNHLSFMVISIALFGFGASGSFLSMADIHRKKWLPVFQSQTGLTVLLYLFASSTLVSFLIINHLPLDYFRLPVDPFQLLYLMAAYLVLALPFFFSGTIISIAYIAVPDKSGLVYFAGMIGSALGAAMPIPLLHLLEEGRLMAAAALIALVPVLLPVVNRLAGDSTDSAPAQLRWFSWLGYGSVPALIAVCLWIPPGSRLIQVVPSPYKALSQILRFPETHITERQNSIRGRIERVNTPYIRFAPGLSLNYTGPLPGQDAVYTDGDHQLVVYDLAGDRREADFATHLLSYAGYHLQGKPENVLVVLAGGGSSIACAAASGADDITVVVTAADMAAMLRRHYSYRILAVNRRAYLARTDQTYDIIHLENWGASIPGAAALNQGHMFTIEALIDYWNHLNSAGVLIVSRKLLLPPSNSLRLWSTAYEALQAAKIEQPGLHLAMLRNFDTLTLIMSKSRIHRQRVEEFAGALNFDLVYLQGMASEHANRFHVFDEPFHHDEIKRLAEMYASGRQRQFFGRYLLDVAPQSDLRPFPDRFLKWTRLIELYRSMGSRLYALFLSGELVVATVFIEALAVAILLLVLPIVAGTRGAPKPRISLILHFLGIGAGYMFIEIYFIKRLIILVGDPILSFMLVISGLLFSSGLGGIWIYRRPRANLRRILIVLAAVLMANALIFETLLPTLLRMPSAARLTLGILFLLPAGFLMGLPFPGAMRDLLDTPVQRAYAWSVNGCAAVLSAIAAAQVAISWSIAHVAAAGIVAYGMAAIAVKKS